jgi:hypothetical protein
LLHKTRKLYRILTVYIAKLLNEIKLSFAGKVPKKLLKSILLFRIIEFLHEYEMELIHVRGDLFKIPELDYIFSMENLNAVKLYFKERKRIHFFNHKGNIYAKVKDFVFLLPFPYGIFELTEVFYDECYGGIDVSNGIVVDIGACARARNLLYIKIDKIFGIFFMI